MKKSNSMKRQSKKYDTEERQMWPRRLTCHSGDDVGEKPAVSEAELMMVIQINVFPSNKSLQIMKLNCMIQK